MALSIKYDSLALRTESREEWICSNVSMRMVRVRDDHVDRVLFGDKKENMVIW